MPVIEAMRCGVPVLTSEGTSMEEIAGGNALLIDPNDTDDIAQGLQQLVNTSDKEKRDRAMAHSLSFTWEKTAENVLKSWGKMLKVEL